MPVSIATLCRTASGVSRWPLATIAMSSEITRSASATSAGSPDRVSALPRAWMIGSEDALECAQILVGGP